MYVNNIRKEDSVASSRRGRCRSQRYLRTDAPACGVHAYVHAPWDINVRDARNMIKVLSTEGKANVEARNERGLMLLHIASELRVGIHTKPRKVTHATGVCACRCERS